MLFKYRDVRTLTESDVTPKATYLNRRQFMSGAIASAATLGSFISTSVQSAPLAKPPVDVVQVTDANQWLSSQIANARSTQRGIGQTLTPYRAVTSYNNFYEFGMDKSDPAARAGSLNPHPWQVSIEGLCQKTGRYDLQDLIKGIDLEERIYRLRCVEAWSMVIPWVGFSLAELIKRCQPLGSAKYIEFKTLVDKKQMPAQGSAFSTIDWPYTEGLRLDEAMHPLTLMAVGLYGEVLPNQNGAPWRLVVPWKYGFKSIKSIVSIRFTDSMPKTSWNQLAPREYGFYANVNPKVNHPRWSQAYERRLPSGLFSANRIPTTLFNGYADEVAGLYKGMDLRRFF